MMVMMVGDSDGDDGGDGEKQFLPYPQTIHKNLTQLRNGEILLAADTAT